VTTGIVVLVLVLVLATAFGLWRRATDGRMRSVGRSDAPIPAKDDDPEVDVVVSADATARMSPQSLGIELGREATLVQFSTAFCQPCRATRRILDEVSAMVDGVAHVEIDAESHLDLVRAHDIRRTPTVLVLDRDGFIRRRAAGLPRKADVIAALGEVIDPAKGLQEQ